MTLNNLAPIEDSPLTLVDRPVPQPAGNELLVRVLVCGICRTDLHVIEGDLPQQELPLVPGHQVVGIVAGLGDNCEAYSLGDRVGIAWLRHTCGECDYCRTGKENLCESSRFTGYHADGGYAEYAVVPAAYAYAIPDGLEVANAAPLLCAGIIGYRALKRACLPDKGTLTLFGFGSSAHIVLQIAKHRGCTVYVVTRGEKHQALARDMGAAWASGSTQGIPGKADSAIIFAPAGELVPDALEILEKGGTLSLAGIYMSDIPAMEYDRHLFYEKNVHSVTANTREDGRQLLKEAVSIPIQPHVTVYPLAEANRALQDLKADRINGSGVLLVGTE